MSGFNRGARGLSLIEAIVAVTVLIIIMAGALEVFDRGFAATVKTRERTIAQGLAREILEENSDWSKLQELDGSPWHGGSDGPDNGSFTYDPDLTLNGVTYVRSITVADGPIYPAELKKLTATVSWGTSSVSLTTLKGNFDDYK